MSTVDTKPTIEWLPPTPGHRTERWTDHDDDPAVVDAARAIRKALLSLPEDRRTSALYLADVCPHCGREKGGMICHCTNDE